MSGPLPVYLDTRKVFLQQLQLDGDIELARLPRLRQMLASNDGSISAKLDCDIDDNGLRRLSGQVSASLNVSCQRCLEPVEIRIQDDINLAVLTDEEQARDLDPALDPWICADIKLDLAELLEEQLILSLPVVTNHEDRDCLGQTSFGEDEARQGDRTSRDHPFAALKALKKDGTV